jgi:hypothetical protein
MEILRFVSLGEAEGYLTAQAFVFMGAPNRWRRVVGETATYAEVHVSGTGSVVVLRFRASDNGQDGAATAGDRRDAG